MTEPKFMLESTRFASAKVSRNAVPSFFDWNNDGKKDLLFASEESDVYYFENTGTLEKPAAVHQLVKFVGGIDHGVIGVNSS